MRTTLVVLLANAGCSSFHEYEGDAGSSLRDAPPSLMLPPKDSGPRDGKAPDASVADASHSPFTIAYGVPQGESLLAVWGSDPATIFAVGSNGIHCDYYTGSWTCSQDVLGRTYYAVWGTSMSDVYAVGAVGADGGTSGVIQHFDGTGWSDQYVTPTPLHGVWGVGDQVLAVGSGGNVYGKSPAMMSEWGVVATLPANPNVPVTAASPILWSVSGTSTTEFAIAAGLDRIFQYVGNDDFANFDPTPDRTIDFQTVWAVPGETASDFFGTNYFGVTYLTGSGGPPDAATEAQNLYRIFEDQSLPTASDLYIWGIWGTTATTVFVGDLGRIYTLDIATNTFAPFPSPTNLSLYGVWGSSLGDVWIVGENELILHGAIPN